MLGKLMKYEFKSTARIFLPLYAVLLVFAVLNRFVNPFQAVETSFSIHAFLQALSMIAYVVLIVAVFVITLVITIQRFYKNLLGDEGYLMFTLPVKTWQHITSKLLTAMIWFITSTGVIACSILIIVGTKEVFDFFPLMVEMIRDNFGYAGFVLLPIFALGELAAGTMMIYTAIALGHLFPKYRLLASFGMYCVLYSIYQVLLVIIMFLLGSTVFASIINSATPTPMEIYTFLGILLLIATLMMTAHFAVTNYILKKKLNLE